MMKLLLLSLQLATCSIATGQSNEPTARKLLSHFIGYLVRPRKVDQGSLSQDREVKGKQAQWPRIHSPDPSDFVRQPPSCIAVDATTLPSGFEDNVNTVQLPDPEKLNGWTMDFDSRLLIPSPAHQLRFCESDDAQSSNFDSASTDPHEPTVRGLSMAVEDDIWPKPPSDQSEQQESVELELSIIPLDQEVMFGDGKIEIVCNGCSEYVQMNKQEVTQSSPLRFDPAPTKALNVGASDAASHPGEAWSPPSSHSAHLSSPTAQESLPTASSDAMVELAQDDEIERHGPDAVEQSMEEAQPKIEKVEESGPEITSDTGSSVGEVSSPELQAKNVDEQRHLEEMTKEGGCFDGSESDKEIIKTKVQCVDAECSPVASLVEGEGSEDPSKESGEKDPRDDDESSASLMKLNASIVIGCLIIALLQME